MIKIGQRYISLVQDREEDDEYGEVVHLPGTAFRVDHLIEEDRYCIVWDQAVDMKGYVVRTEGMWTIWTEAEILRDAEPLKENK